MPHKSKIQPEEKIKAVQEYLEGRLILFNDGHIDDCLYP